METEMQILVAEINPGEAQRLVRALETLCWSAQVATSPEQILDLLRRQIFHEAIVAVELDIADKPALAHLTLLPIVQRLVAVGPPGDINMEIRARTAGAGAYITRPVTPGVLAGVLRVSNLDCVRGPP